MCLYRKKNLFFGFKNCFELDFKIKVNLFLHMYSTQLNSTSKDDTTYCMRASKYYLDNNFDTVKLNLTYFWAVLYFKYESSCAL